MDRREELVLFEAHRTGREPWMIRRDRDLMDRYGSLTIPRIDGCTTAADALGTTHRTITPRR